MIAVVNSGGANISSVNFALKRLEAEVTFTNDPNVISNAQKVILPGVGSAATAMKRLKEFELIECIRNLSQPVLGICLGMQILFEHSQEADTDLLGVVPGKLKRFNESNCGIIPHMGWNKVQIIERNKLLNKIPQNSYFYFVHSFFMGESENTLGISNYGENFSAVISFNNFFGCQFHPERSGGYGAQILKNFLEM